MAKATAKAKAPKGPTVEKYEGLATTHGKEFALAALEHRRKNKPKQIDNASLYAGSPMYYYCYTCGHESDCLPEGHFDRPSHICGECQALKSLGWLE